MKLRLLVVALVFACMAWPVWMAGQEAPKPPALTETQRLQWQNVILRIQLAQAQMQQAQTEATVMLQAFQREGWTFDPSSMSYTALPKPEGKRP